MRKEAFRLPEEDIQRIGMGRLSTDSHRMSVFRFFVDNKIQRVGYWKLFFFLGRKKGMEESADLV